MSFGLGVTMMSKLHIFNNHLACVKGTALALGPRYCPSSSYYLSPSTSCLPGLATALANPNLVEDYCNPAVEY